MDLPQPGLEWFSGRADTQNTWVITRAHLMMGTHLIYTSCLLSAEVTCMHEMDTSLQ